MALGFKVSEAVYPPTTAQQVNLGSLATPSNQDTVCLATHFLLRNTQNKKGKRVLLGQLHTPQGCPPRLRPKLLRVFQVAM